MKRQQNGFTLIEIVIAFTILAMGTVLVVNIVTQSSIRVDKVNEHLAAMDTLDSAVAILRQELSQREIKKTYRGEHNNGYTWAAKVLNEVNPFTGGYRKYLNLYRIQIQVFHDQARPRLELTTVVANR